MANHEKCKTPQPMPPWCVALCPTRAHDIPLIDPILALPAALGSSNFACQRFLEPLLANCLRLRNLQQSHYHTSSAQKRRAPESCFIRNRCTRLE